MKKPMILIALLALAVACAGADERGKPMTAEEKEVYAAYEAINAAMIAKDRAALERYFDENLTFTHMSGKKQTVASLTACLPSLC